MYVGVMKVIPPCNHCKILDNGAYCRRGSKSDAIVPTLVHGVVHVGADVGEGSHPQDQKEELGNKGDQLKFINCDIPRQVYKHH